MAAGPRSKAHPLTKKINLALQGGGAHGAFTWGVLDRLLEDDEIEIAGDVRHLGRGTERGRVEGRVCLTGGREGARENLDWLWGRIGSLGDMRLTGWMAGMGPSAGAISQALEYSMPFNMADAASAGLFALSFRLVLPKPFRRHCLTVQIRQGLRRRRSGLFRLRDKCRNRQSEDLFRRRDHHQSHPCIFLSCPRCFRPWK